MASTDIVTGGPQQPAMAVPVTASISSGSVTGTALPRRATNIKAAGGGAPDDAESPSGGRGGWHRGRRGKRGGHYHQQHQGASNVPEDWPPTTENLSKFKSVWQPLEQEDLSSADYYFNSYAHFGIHEDMLKDQVRTGSYCRAIQQNKHLFEGKTVLDVGSGTGILSMFAAKAGARHVYGVECSEIVVTAEKICKANNLENKVTFIKGKVEEIVLPVDKVDIIISEWMGYFLLYESMLDTVLFARDKWLVQHGLIFPDRACMYLAAIEDADYKEEKFGFWQNVYGFDFSCVQRCIIEEPIVDNVEERAISTDACCILDLDLQTCKKGDLDFVAPYRLTLRRKDFVHAFISWFDVYFSACHKVVSFTTGPHGKYTHWKQTVFYIEDVIVGHKNDTVSGMIAVKKSEKNHRDLDVKIAYEFNGERPVSRTQFYRLR